MKNYALTHLSDESLRRELSVVAANEKEATAELVAHIAEFDARKLYLPHAYQSMLEYCTKELRLSEEAAKKRIRVARAGHSCPGVFEALASGRVHLSGLVTLAKHLSPQNAGELLAEATDKSREEIECLIAARFPKLDAPTEVTPLPAAADPGGVRSPGTVDSPELAGAQASEHAARHVPERASVTPLSAERFALQVTIDSGTRQKLEYAKALLGHQLPSGDLAQVLDRALDALVERLEKRFGLGTRRRAGHRRPAPGSRHIAMEVRHDVYVRDKGCCTYKSASGRRCEARSNLEFDHVIPFARGGEATVDNLRLRCREHNQHGAEETFGAGFMQQKREESASVRAAKRASRATDAPPPEPSAGTDEHDVYRALRTLGFLDGESRRALALCAEIPDATREDKLRRALTWFPQRCHGATAG